MCACERKFDPPYIVRRQNGMRNRIVSYSYPCVGHVSTVLVTRRLVYCAAQLPWLARECASSNEWSVLLVMNGVCF